MKRAVLSSVFLAALATLGGCPIYSHEDEGCWRDRDCDHGYLCDDNSGTCYLPGSSNARCVRPADCGVNQTCSSAGVCVSGDCSFSGCVSGYRCDVSTGIWQCVSNANNGTPNGGAGGGSSAGAGGDSSAAAGDGSSAGAGNGSSAGAAGVAQGGAAGTGDSAGAAGAGDVSSAGSSGAG